MSWEEMRTEETACPCGKGRITMSLYGDDWNRIEEGPVIIECKECANRYKVEKEIQRGMLRSDGEWNIYYLTPKDYPDYSGVKESDFFPEPASKYEDFPAWLIENYTESGLRNVLDQLRRNTSSAKLIGNAKKVRDEYRKAKNTVRISEITRTVEAALERYPGYVGNKAQREEIRDRERNERMSYIREKRKHQIVIEWDR